MTEVYGKGLQKLYAPVIEGTASQGFGVAQNMTIFEAAVKSKKFMRVTRRYLWHIDCVSQLSVKINEPVKGKPRENVGRKATGLSPD